MCGVVGAISNLHNIVEDLVAGLGLLQYRGYDSYGICFINEGNLRLIKDIGHIDNKQFHNLSGTIGIGHTRWATHGPASLNNAHPIVHGHIAVAQNGIIENYQDIKSNFPDFPYITDTDTEVTMPLFMQYEHISLAELGNILKQLTGSFAILALNSQTDEIYFMRKGRNPLLIGIKGNDYLIGSDMQLFQEFDRIINVQDMQYGIISHNKLSIFPHDIHYIKHDARPEMPIKSHKTWFETEFINQPILLRKSEAQNYLPNIKPKSITLVGCGSAYLAGLTGQYWLRQIGNVDARAVQAHELIDNMHDCIAAISQSGETSDTIAALERCRCNHKVAFLNNINSTMAQYVDHIVPVMASPEISVASTKATTSQMIALLKWALRLGNLNIDAELNSMYDLLNDFIATRLNDVAEIAKICLDYKHIFIIGRNILYPIALEAALKIKELAYIHAEGMNSAELKHGPLAIIDDSTLVICLTKGYDNAVSEILARGGKVVVFTEEPKHFQGATTFTMECISTTLTPFLYILPMQWLAYSLALLKNNNIDMPRNLAKSVTVT